MNGTLKHLYQNMLSSNNKSIIFKNNIITIKHYSRLFITYTTKYLIKVYDGRIMCIGTFYDGDS